MSRTVYDGGASTVTDRMCAVGRYYDIYSKADRGDIFIIHDQKSSYRTPLGNGVKSLDPLLDPMLVQWVLGSSGCMTMAALLWGEYAGSSWRMKELIPLNGPHTRLN